MPCSNKETGVGGLVKTHIGRPFHSQYEYIASPDL